MSAMKYLTSAPLLDLELFSYNKKETSGSIAFTGIARKHPYDNSKLVLVSNEGGDEGVMYEFRITDVVHAEPLPHMMTAEGSGYKVVRLWIRKGITAVKLQPFTVGEDK